MSSLEDLGSVGHALSALSYGRDTAACCAAEMAVHACEQVSRSTRGDLVLFLMAAPANGRSAVVLYGGQHAQGCDSAQQNNIATGMRLIMGSLRAAPPPSVFNPIGPSIRRPDSSPRSGTSAASRQSPVSGTSAPVEDSDRLHLASGLPRSTPSGAPRRPEASRRSSTAGQARPLLPAVAARRPMAPFPGLLTFSPMVGANFQLDRSKISEIENNNKVIVPEFLSVSLLGRLRERIAHDRPLCKHFLKLIRHAVTEFLKQLPPGSRGSASANKYESMTPVAVSKVAIVYMDGGEKKTAVAPMLTNTSSVDTVKFLGLLCYMVHIKDAAYLWLVEEFCAGVEVPTIAKSKPSAKDVDQAAMGGAGSAASAGNGNTARENEAGTPPPPVAGGNGGSVGLIGAGMGAGLPPSTTAAGGSVLAGGVGAATTAPPAAAAAVGGGLAGGVGAGAPVAPAAAAARSGGLAGGVEGGTTAPPAAAAAVGGGLAGRVGAGATVPPAAAAAVGGGLAGRVGAGAAAPPAAAAAVGDGLAGVVGGGATAPPVAAAALGGGLSRVSGEEATAPPAVAAAVGGGLAGGVGARATVAPAAAAARSGGLAGGVEGGATAPPAVAAAVGGGLAGGVGSGATVAPAAAAARSGGLAGDVEGGATAPPAVAAAVGGGLALVVSGRAVQGPESGLACVGGQERCQLLADDAVVASGVTLSMRSHCGRDAVPLSLLAVHDVKVVEGHGEYAYRFAANASTNSDGGEAGGVSAVIEPDLQEASGNLLRGGSQRTLGAAAVGSAVLLWQVKDIG